MSNFVTDLDNAYYPFLKALLLWKKYLSGIMII